jgi:dinuclear metal center YbgI/SA1388 family protein|tara:strand:- start:4314 stop:5408 length:1095 start_codon:yes stop_codon:yes gene_type:complete
MKVKDITKSLQEWAPLSLQESFDNAGLIIGNDEMPLTGCLITLDVTEEIIDEALNKGCNLIIAHHPIIFKGIKKLSGDHWITRCLIKAIKNDVAIYAIHTNLDNILSGVNSRIADLLGLKDRQVLRGIPNTLLKLVVFVPITERRTMLAALHKAGAGNIGAYEQCSFQIIGEGTFLPTERANPTVGDINLLTSVQENRIEVILPSHKKESVLKAMHETHPYEEVAYYLTPLDNYQQEIGSGLIGQLDKPIASTQFINTLKSDLNLKSIRHTKLIKTHIEWVAICGGSGSFLLTDALGFGADIFISADFKYHEFFEADDKITIADIGHYESEVLTKELLSDFLREKFTNIAVHLAEVITNPIIYS